MLITAFQMYATCNIRLTTQLDITDTISTQETSQQVIRWTSIITWVPPIYVGSREEGMSYGSEWGILYLHWKLRGGNVTQSPNCTEVKSCADGLNVTIQMNPWFVYKENSLENLNHHVWNVKTSRKTLVFLHYPQASILAYFICSRCAALENISRCYVWNHHVRK